MPSYRCKGREVHGLYPVEQTRAIHQPDRITSHKSSQRVSCYADLLDVVPLLLQLRKPLLNLVGDTLSPHFDAIVCLIVAVAGRDQDVQVGILGS